MSEKNFKQNTFYNMLLDASTDQIISNNSSELNIFNTDISVKRTSIQVNGIF